MTKRTNVNKIGSSRLMYESLISAFNRHGSWEDAGGRIPPPIEIAPSGVKDLQEAPSVPASPWPCNSQVLHITMPPL